MLLLTTNGRRTGKPHKIAIEYFTYEKVIYIISGYGRKADWFRNILKDNRVEVTIRGKRLNGLAEVVAYDALRKDVLKKISENLGWARSGRSDKSLVVVKVEANL
jgi:deazaflavin-dependent oxidoreductase (nitroreductase family)